MIRRISGTAIEVLPTYVIVDVNGVGYQVFTTTHASLLEGSPVTLYTYLAVRETALDLYGFSTVEELGLFELLMTLPKIGPKSAIQILSQADPALLQNAIITQDYEHLSKMSGITKKTAEKIVLGLKDAFEGYELIKGTNAVITAEHTTFSGDAIDALIALGYPQQDARKAIQEILAVKPEITTTNEAIKEALKLLS